MSKAQGRRRPVAELVRLFLAYIGTQFKRAPEELLKGAEERAATEKPLVPHHEGGTIPGGRTDQPLNSPLS